MSGSGLYSFFGGDKLASFWRIVQKNGGIRKSIRVLYQTDDLKDGELVGEDKFGNKYFQNNKYFYGRNRWVSHVDIKKKSNPIWGYLRNLNRCERKQLQRVTHGG